MKESRMFGGGEVDFKLRRASNADAYHYEEEDRKRRQRAWQRRRSEPSPIVGWFIIAAIIIAIALWLASCGRRDNLIPVKTSDGKTLMLTREQVATIAVTGGDVSWDFTKLKHPPEPTTPLGPK